MTSPFTGGKAKLMTEESTLKYRNEMFTYTRYFYVCEDTGIHFTDAEVDDKGLRQVHEQYRQRHGIPSAEKIRAIRKKYNLSAGAMSRILGLGANQYRLYENGEMPTEQIGKMICTIEDRTVMMKYVTASENSFAEGDYLKIRSKVLSTEEAASYTINSSSRYRAYAYERKSRSSFHIKFRSSGWSRCGSFNDYSYGQSI